MRGIFFNKTTGEILRRMSCPNLAEQVQSSDEDYIETDLTDTKGYKVDLETKELVPTDPPKSIMDVVESLKEGADDSTVNTIISKIPNVTDVTQWRLDNYQVLRYNTYPPMVDYLDAQAKLSDPQLVSEGETQLSQYNARCLDVKRRFPKEGGGG